MMIGSNVSHYRILERLGHGGMGVVYKAEDTRLGRTVALKFLAGQVSADPVALERFKREARAASALNHPSICTIHDIDESGGSPFIVMELLEGKTLRETIAGRPIPVSQIIDLALNITDGLDQAHQRGILHRDIKPENIFITTSGRAKLLDFGLAKLAGSENSADISAMSTAVGQVFTAPGSVAGTVAYMSPEQARGEPLDARTDLYSLGVVLYEMMSGRPPFTGSTLAVLYEAILTREPQPLKQLSGDVPPELERIVMQLMAKHPAFRPQSAREVFDTLQALKQVQQQRRSAPSSRNLPRTLPSIAVLPFANLSPDPENEYFSDGMTEEIINALHQLPDLRVAARASSFAFKGRTPDLAEVASKLKVSAVLSGSVRRAGTRLRVSVELVNIADGFPMWSERYDRQADDVFKIQDEIATAIAGRLKIALGGSGSQPIVLPPTSNFQAYEIYLKGRVFLSQRSNIPRAIEYFRRALELDPEFALAYASIAESYMLLGFYGFLRPKEAMPAARDAANRALALDPTLADPHVALAFISWIYEWNWDSARSQFEKAIELNPQLAWTYVWQSLYFAGTEGRFEEAITGARRATELDPLSGTTFTALGWVLHCAGLNKEAEQAARSAIQIEPMLWTAHRVLGVTLATQGHYEEAIATMEAALPISGRHVWIVVNLAEVYARAGMTDKAKVLHIEMEQRARNQYVQPLFLGLINAAVGQVDRAFEIFEGAYDERDDLPIINYSPVLGSGLRQDVRYTQLVERVGLVPAPDLPRENKAN